MARSCACTADDKPRRHEPPLGGDLRGKFRDFVSEVDGSSSRTRAIRSRCTIGRRLSTPKCCVRRWQPPGRLSEQVRSRCCRARRDRGQVQRLQQGHRHSHLMMHSPFRGRRPVFIGDDVTDEAAFAVLPEFDGVGFSVGRRISGLAGCVCSTRRRAAMALSRH